MDHGAGGGAWFGSLCVYRNTKHTTLNTRKKAASTVLWIKQGMTHRWEKKGTKKEKRELTKNFYVCCCVLVHCASAYTISALLLHTILLLSRIKKFILCSFFRHLVSKKFNYIRTWFNFSSKNQFVSITFSSKMLTRKLATTDLPMAKLHDFCFLFECNEQYSYNSLGGLSTKTLNLS